MAHLSIKKYNQTSVSNVADSNPYQLVGNIYKQLLGNVARAKGAMQQKDIEQKGKLISESMTLLAVLQGSLDFTQGGDISNNLDSLYEYCTHQLFQANLKNDPALLDDVIQILLPIKSAWDSIPAEEQTKVSFD